MSAVSYPVTLTSTLPKNANTPKGIIALAEVVHRIRSSSTRDTLTLTPEERALASSWRGWGPLAPAFEYNPKEQWEKTRAQLRLLLGVDGYAQASAATPTSFFTADFLVDQMWTIAHELGFSGGRVLEPGCGSGQFMARIPDALTGQVHFTGIEREAFSATLAQALYPDATIFPASLESVSLVNNAFDLVIGNVPFSEVIIRDRESHEKFSTHNYFLWRGLQALRPGGLMVVLTSRYTLDAQEEHQRRLLFSLGTFVGALRLPSHAHKEAGTAVVTDILVFQRRAPNITEYEYYQTDNTEWLRAHYALCSSYQQYNSYWKSYPQFLIGTPSEEHGMYGNNQLVVHMPEEDYPDTLQRARQSLIEESSSYRFIPATDPTSLDSLLVSLRSDGLKEESYSLLDGTLVQILGGIAVPVKRMVPELTLLVRLRDTLKVLLDAETNLDATDDDLLPVRQLLTDLYDQYVSKYGFIHRTIESEQPIRPGTKKEKKDTSEYDAILSDERGEEEEGESEVDEKRISSRRPAAMQAFRRDPDYPLILSLEHYDEEEKKGRKAAIFTQRVNQRVTPKTSADTPMEALALSLDHKGKLDLAYIQQLLSDSEHACPLDELPERLGTLVYHDPQKGEWVLAADYLSGNVRVKLLEAKAATLTDTRYQRNVDALEQVVPPDILPSEIKAMLGANWIPAKDIKQFCAELLGGEHQAVVSYEPATSTWTVNPPRWNGPDEVALTSTWGTKCMNAYTIIEYALNKRIPTIYDLIDDNKVKNLDDSLAAQEKQEAIKARFQTWIWEQEQRADRLARIYNDTYNAEVPRVYDGSHLTFPGMTSEWQEKLYTWQRDIVWRGILSPAILGGHPVGAGKTKSQMALAMTLKRMGLTNKPAIVVPNHLLEQIASEAQQLYPNAKVLIIGRDDLSRERRKLFAARIATGSYDVIVMTHGALNTLPVHQETERIYMEERIAAFRKSLLTSDTGNKRGIKRIEKAMEAMRQKLDTMLERHKHDDGVTFEQLGISYLIIDECHLFKNLSLPTNIDGFGVPGSLRASNLEMKLRWLEKHNTGKPFAAFFTATAISNSMVEAFVMLWYLARSLLSRYNINCIDDFASLFIEFQTRVEVAPDGGSFRLHTRPSNFVNLPELMTLCSLIMDLRDSAILDEKRPMKHTRTIAIEPTEKTRAYVKRLVERSERIHSGSVKPYEDNMLAVVGDGRKAALDLSLVGIEDERSAKLESVADQMMAVWKRWQIEADYLPGEQKSLQIAFCDLGTPNETSDQVYGKLKWMLVRRGMTREAIRFIHEAKTDRQKAQLFRECRTGKVAVIIGSIEKMGTGTNIQTRAAAVHLITAPWRPDMVEQAIGRAHRPGNLYPDVEVFYYVQSGTFDAYMWQTLAQKAVFFSQFLAGKVTGRESGKLAEMVMSYEQVKGAATGDPLIGEQAEINTLVARLTRLYSAHQQARIRDERDANDARRQASYDIAHAEFLESLATTIEQAPSSPGFVSSSGTPYDERVELGKYIADALLKSINRGGVTSELGSWSGVPVHLRVETLRNNYNVFLVLGSTHYGQKSTSANASAIWVPDSWISEGQEWRFARALEEVVHDLRPNAQQYLEKAKQSLANAEGYEQQMQQPFSQQEELDRLLARKQRLDSYVEMAAKHPTAEETVQLRADLLATITVEQSLVTSSASSGIMRAPKALVAPVAQEQGKENEEHVATPTIPTPTMSEVIAAVKKQVEARPVATFGDMEVIASMKRRANGSRKRAQQQCTLFDEVQQEAVTIEQVSLWS